VRKQSQMQTMDPVELMRELEPTVEANLNRHMSVAQEWMPHEYVPWNQGRDFIGPDGEPPRRAGTPAASATTCWSREPSIRSRSSATGC